MMKDYYTILGVTPESAEDEIRKSYRKMAMQYHPDHNPGDAGAEEKFKEIAEAYGVLTDPVKRKEYDLARRMGADYNASGNQGGFRYSQEDILRDLFQDPRFQQMFHGLLREFAKKGFRSNQSFVKHAFFGGKGGILFGGLFLFGSIAGPAILNTAKKSLPGKQGLLKSIGSAVGSLLSGSRDQEHTPGANREQPSGTSQALVEDTTYTAKLSEDEFFSGKTIQIVTQGPDGQEKLKVKVPPGSRAGQKLRLKGKGIAGPEGRGDLYLRLEQG